MNKDNKITIDSVNNPNTNIDITVKDNPQINVNVKEQGKIDLDFNNKLSVIPTLHSQLLGLDYESSGHTGFASEKRVNALENRVVPRRLNTLPNLPNSANRSNCFIYVDNNGTDSKTNIKQLLSKVIRLSNYKPNDMENGDFLFLVKGDR